ncbi:hypothetical protein [Halocatena salina]|uniref:Uncharacterized protein n=1 Tax=Halocatena salina TaxID=2934340 RepID=A0A8T9ZZ62_9EURY|nr:hypothetical protein [Halocatena salina]UPM41719.1 hypothetical protein MW046_06885 [Halocatena salina]
MQPRVTRRDTASSAVSTFLQSEAAIGQMKSSLVLFAAIGIGLGIVGSTLSGSVGTLGQDIAMATIIPIALATPIVGIIPGRQIGNHQTDAQPLAVYALVAITTGVGAIVQFMIASVLTAVEASGTSVPDLFVFSFVVALGTIIAGLGSAFAVRN